MGARPGFLLFTSVFVSEERKEIRSMLTEVVIAL